MIEIRWSPSVLAELERLAAGPVPRRHPAESKLAPALLLGAAGEMERAEAVVLQALREGGDWKNMNGEAFIILITALFVVQRLDIVSKMLVVRYGFSSDLELEFGGCQSHPAQVRWDLRQRGRARFVFADKLLQNDRTRNQILTFCWIFPLLADYMRSGGAEDGSIMISLWDVGLSPGLAFCDNRSDYFLIPDSLFISTKGYDYVRRAYRENEVSWDQRRSIALWRGTTTGHPADQSAGWRSLPRVALCEIGRLNEAIIDAGITLAAQVSQPAEVEAELVAAGLWRSFIPPAEFNRYKYQIDIDGNTNSWPGLFQKLLTGSPVLKVASSIGYRQWYYDRLEPWHNYVPVSSDMSDLANKIHWLRAHDDIARRIGSAGRILAETATYGHELGLASRTITAALRRFRFSQRMAQDGQNIVTGMQTEQGAIATESPTVPTHTTKRLMSALHGRDIYSGYYPTHVEDLQGWNSHHPIFKKVISEIKPQVVLDVGVWKGASTIHLARLLRDAGLDGTVVAIDTFLGSPEHWGSLRAMLPVTHGMPRLYDQFLSNVIHSEVRGYVVPLPQTSEAAAIILRAAGVQANLVHIDAAHEYQAVLRDARAYWALLAPGGYLIGDDYHESWAGVMRAADEFAAEVGSSIIAVAPKWMIRKPA